MNTNYPDVPYGLIYNCEIINGRIVSSGTNMSLADGDGKAQHRLWTNDIELGSSNSVYVEDCTFTGGHSIDGNYGGSYVFRYNTITGGLGIEAHAAFSCRAIRYWEIYRNTLNKGDSFMYVWPRGGTGVIFDNTFNGDISFRMDVRRVFEGDNRCDGNSGWDQNLEYPNHPGYACRDQIGRGKDNELWYHNPPEPYNQQSHPAYFWLNRSDNSIKNAERVNGSEYYIQPNRDYYEEVSNFDGTSGVGVGTLAQRPSKCTPGVAYWATDQGNWNKKPGGQQGVLYKCTSPNTWTLYYTPYPYPHPLRNEGTSDTTPPAAPRNLRVE
jgi:hypothetical protein